MVLFVLLGAKLITVVVVVVVVDLVVFVKQIVCKMSDLVTVCQPVFSWVRVRINVDSDAITSTIQRHFKVVPVGGSTNAANI